jgi:hypothetical protein
LNHTLRKKYAGVKKTNFKDGELEEVNHNPKFMNDATKDQKQLQSYEIEAPESLKAIQRNLDPDGLWATRIDGVKLT